MRLKEKCKALKERIEDFYDSIYYKITSLSITRFWENIGRWFSYYKVLRKVYDFDYWGVLIVERHQLERLRDSIAYYNNHVEAERDVEKINTALKLLDILEENGCSKRIGKPFEFKKLDNSFYELVNDPDVTYTIPVYVNTRNSQRFWDFEKSKFEDPNMGNLFKDDLRLKKAWYLYHKMRLYFMRSWWD